ncbi:MAG: hypothetical protein DI566_14755 [Microbacterium sp.]|nr:MAG: hypothetical protein DI566_14755 [Microbacterium sp.]
MLLVPTAPNRAPAATAATAERSVRSSAMLTCEPSTCSRPRTVSTAPNGSVLWPRARATGTPARSIAVRSWSAEFFRMRDSMGSIVITVPEAWLAMSAPRPSARSTWAMFSRLM